MNIRSPKSLIQRQTWHFSLGIGLASLFFHILSLGSISASTSITISSAFYLITLFLPIIFVKIHVTIEIVYKSIALLIIYLAMILISPSKPKDIQFSTIQENANTTTNSLIIYTVVISLIILSFVTFYNPLLSCFLSGLSFSAKIELINYFSYYINACVQGKQIFLSITTFIFIFEIFVVHLHGIFCESITTNKSTTSQLICHLTTIIVTYIFNSMIFSEFGDKGIYRELILLAIQLCFTILGLTLYTDILKPLTQGDNVDNQSSETAAFLEGSISSSFGEVSSGHFKVSNI